MKNKVTSMLILFFCIVICLCLSPVASAENNSGNGEIPDGVSPWSWLQAQFDQGGTVTLPQDITAGASDTVLTIAADKTVNLDLNGFKIDRAKNRATAVIRVKGTLILSDSGNTGKITGSSASSYSSISTCAGVLVEGGVFTMNGGLICDNKVTAGDGAGVYVTDGGVFTMNAGTISNNTANDRGGGVYISSDSSFHMNGGTISNNTALNGGGVCIASGSSFTMSGDSTISGNTASNGAGVLLDQTFSSQSSFTMTGGSISNNTGDRYSNGGTGGGVRMSDGTLFTMSGGEILGNTASSGAGISMSGNGQLVIEGGAITGNTAGSYSGRGGIELSSNCGISISGNPTIAENTAKGTASNLYLPAGKMITVAGPLSNTTPIKITSQTAPMADAPVVFTNGLNDNASETNFMSDNEDYVTVLNADQEAMLAVPLQITMPEETTKGTVRILELNGTPVTQMPDYVLYHDVVTLMLTPAEGYELAPDGLSVSWVDENDQLQSVELTQGTEDESNEWTFVMPGADVTVAATFSPIVYSISYELDGGWFEDGITAPENYTIEDENVILSRPVWDNHAFRGWYDNAEFTGDSVNTLVAGSTGDKVFYAKWAELSGYWNNLNWNLNTDGLLTISGWGDMSPFTAPQEGQGETEAWRPLADLIQRVQIINEVTSIGDYAFYSCENLIEVEIPLTVQRIDAWAFANDSSLTQISFPESLITIGAHAFSNDFNLTQISLPGNLEAIQESAFSGCDALLDVNYSGIEQQWECVSTREGNDTLKNAEINYTAIVDDYGTWGALSWKIYSSKALVISGNGPMNGLEDKDAWSEWNETVLYVFIENGVSTIGENAFRGCLKLKAIKIPDSVMKIGTRAFAWCGMEHIEIPNSVVIIDNEAFLNCNSLTEIVLPENVTVISNGAFNHCWELQNVVISDNVTEIGSGAFYQAGLGSSSFNISLPDGLKTIGEHAFYDSNLHEITIPGSVISIGFGALQSTKLTSVIIPDNVSSLPSGMFCDCRYLTDITLPETMNSIGYSAFAGCTSLQNISIPSNVNEIGNGAFEGCSALTSVIIPDNVNQIGARSFKNCSSLMSVSLPTALEVINESTFEDCTVLNNVVLPNTVESIGDSAFKNCSALSDIILPNGITIIENGAFQNCDKLENMVLPDGLTSIGERCFYSCNILSSVSLPQSLTRIGNEAFSACSLLEEIVLPENVSTIGSGTFSGCIGISNITIPNPVTTISEHTFDGCAGLTEVTIPSLMTSISDGAFKDCSSLARVNFLGLRSQWETIKIGVNNEALTGADLQCSSILIGEWNNLIWTIDNEGKLAVSGTGAMTDFRDTASKLAWRAFVGTIRSVELHDGVTTIGKNAFADCGELIEITIPESVTAIGGGAFSGCSSLVQIQLPSGLEQISDSVFADCIALQSIEIPAGALSIGDSTFLNCYALSEVSISDSVASIGTDAFSNCTSLNSFVLPVNLASISGNTFNGCTGLSSITIPVTVIQIGENAFYDCASLSEVTYTGIPAQWELIEMGNGNWQLERASRQCVGTVTDSWGDLSWTLDSDGLLTVSGDGAINPIPAGEEETAAWRRYASSIRNVLLEEGISSIGTRAFMNCTALESANLPESLSSINAFAFSNCTGLNTIEIPAAVSYIGSSAFEGCTALNTVDLPESLTTLNNRAFSGCTNLSSVTLPDGLRRIGSYAFSDCRWLNSITLPESLTLIDQGVFYNCGNLWEISIPSNVTSIKASAFQNCTNLYSVNLSENLRSIGDEAFGNCRNLYSVTIPEGINTILSGTFAGCSNLTQISLPESISLIEESSFTGCSALTDVFYDGMQENWQRISIGGDNDALVNATLHITRYRIIVSESEGGIVTADPSVGTVNNTVTLTVVPRTGYELDTISARRNGEDVPLNWMSDTAYSFTMPETDVTVTAAFKAIEYTVRFVDEDGSELQSGSVAYGETPVYGGETPSKAADAQYTYTFSGWTPEPVTVTGEATYTATYSSSVNEYTVRFVDEDDRELQSSSVAYGETPVYGGETPSKAADAQYTYSFAGWTPEPVAVTGEATYTATYNSSVNEYTVRFVDEDGRELQSGSVAYGETPIYSGETPSKAADAQYTYTFAGWSPELVAVTEEATYTATYGGTVNKYTVSFDTDGGVPVPEAQSIEYGSHAVYPETTPVKEGHSFEGWYLGDEAFRFGNTEITDNIVLTAKWKANEYTIIWINDDNTMIGTTTVKHGEVPTHEPPAKEPDEQYTYTFAGWSPAPEAATGVTVYQASYSITVNEYTVVYDPNGGTNAPAEQNKIATQDMILTGDIPTREDWYFVGWAESAEALAAEYLPGGSFDKNANTTLYAVWAQPDFILPAALTEIGEEAFAGGVFRFAKLPEQAVSVGANAFANCTELAYILIPASVQDIADNAFDDGGSLTILGYPGSRAESYASENGYGFVPVT